MLAVIAIVFFPEGFIRCVIDRTERRLMYQHKTFFTDDLHGFFSAQQTACSFRRKDFFILPRHTHDITVIAFIGPGNLSLNPILDNSHILSIITVTIDNASLLTICQLFKVADTNSIKWPTHHTTKPSKLP